MKKMLSLLCFLLYAPQMKAQMSGFGINGGGSFASFDHQAESTPSNIEDGNNSGMTGGMRFDFNLNDESVKLSPEIFIIQNGSKEYISSFNQAKSNLLKQVSLDYIGLYLPLTYYIAMDSDGGYDDHYNGFMFQTKIYTDIAFNANFDNNNLEEENEVVFQNGFDRVDFGASLNAGLVHNGWLISFGYNWGLKDIAFYDDEDMQGNTNYLINNKGFTLQIGIIQKLD